MLGNIKSGYKQQAAQHFEILQRASRPLTLLESALADEGAGEAIAQPIGPMEPRRKLGLCQLMERQLKSRCAGVVEVMNTPCWEHKLEDGIY